MKKKVTVGGATVDSYTWDRANRLLTWDNGVAADLVNHTYDGEGRRVLQAVGTTSPIITKYLLDIQPGLAVVLSQTEGSDVTRFVHAPRGIHARKDASSDWHWTVQDGLGTVRVETDNTVAVEGSQNLDPFGNLINMVNGDIGTPYGFTGELVDGSGLLDLRKRRYSAGIGVFASLDPLETQNRYSYAMGNVVNMVDPLGLYSCQNESLTLMPSVCDELDKALIRANETAVPTAGILGTVVNETVDFALLKTFVQNAFGFTVAGFSGIENNPITTCPDIEKLMGTTGIPSKLSLIRTTAALFHISAKFKQVGLGNGIDILKNQLGNGSTIQLVSDNLVDDASNGRLLGALRGKVYLDLSTPMYLFLGSEIETSAIVHELGHLFDKRLGLRPSTPLEGLFLLKDTGMATYNSQSPGNPNPVDTQFAFEGGLQGRANESRDQEELWADMFMTWVLFGQGMRVNGNPVGWNSSQQRDSNFKILYTENVVKKLLAGSDDLPTLGANQEEKLRFVNPIAIAAWVFTSYANMNYPSY